MCIRDRSVGILGQLYLLSKGEVVGFAGGAVVESPPADAGDTGSCPGPGRSHMPRSGYAREPWPLSLHVRSLCSATGKTATVRGPRTTKKKKVFISILLLTFLSASNVYVYSPSTSLNTK